MPVHDDRTVFEFLTLEAAQAGLSWYTVLRKRESYRDAFDAFDPEKVARYGKRQVGALLRIAGIIRNRQSLLAAINNAGRFLEVQEEFGSFVAYIWRFVGGNRLSIASRAERLPRDHPESDAMSKDLLQRGFKFVGSTICYAYMQATGMVNDHATDMLSPEAKSSSFSPLNAAVISRDCRAGAAAARPSWSHQHK